MNWTWRRADTETYRQTDRQTDIQRQIHDHPAAKQSTALLSNDDATVA